MSITRHRPFSVTQTLADRCFGGIERCVLNLSEELRERGYAVSFVLSSQSPVLETIREQGFPCIPIPIFDDLNPRIIWQMAAALRQLKPDLVNINDSPAIVPCCLGARLSGTPMLTTVHAFHQKWGFLPAGHLVTVSEALRRHMLAQGFRDEQVTTVRNGVNLQVFQPHDRLQAQHALGLPTQQYYFAAICRLARRKGLRMLLEVFPEVFRQAPHVRLLLAGTGPLEHEFRAQVVRNGIEPYVHFLGFQTDVRPVLAAAHCVVLPSEREGLGLVLLEAMASARPVIATDSGGPAEVVRHLETGLLIAPRDPSALRHAMLTVMQNPHWAETAGECARQCAEKEHSLAMQVDGIEAIYHKIAGTRWKTQREWQASHLSHSG